MQTLLLSIGLHYDEGVAYGLEGICAVAAARGDAWRAGALCAAAETIRHRIGVFDVEAFTVHLPHLAALRAHDPAAVAAGERAGGELTRRRGRRRRAARGRAGARRRPAHPVVSAGRPLCGGAFSGGAGSGSACRAAPARTRRARHPSPRR